MRKNKLNHKLRVDNSSGVNGVYWKSARNKWAVDIKIGKKKKWLGSFDDFFEACCVRKAADIKYGFHKNHGVT